MLHTFTVRSMEPVAIHGMVGDRATAVTYLQGVRRGAGNVKGVCDRVEVAHSERDLLQKSGYLYRKRQKRKRKVSDGALS